MISTTKTTVLVLGASGMLGNAVFRLFAQSPEYSTIGSVRSAAALRYFPENLREHVISGVDVENIDVLTGVLASVRPRVVINCIGLVKQLAEADDPLVAIPVNSILPHRIARLCAVAGARLIHVSTDCVFSGERGMYTEQDFSDARDLYGRSKYLGEVDYSHAVTLRTSIIGHELAGSHGLIGWFLSQSSGVKGYRRAIFSGLPTMELARVMRDYVIPRIEMRGVYHVSASPISKYDLLTLVADAYGRTVEIQPDDEVVIDRSLDSTRFRQLTGYCPDAWPSLVAAMRDFG